MAVRLHSGGEQKRFVLLSGRFLKGRAYTLFLPFLLVGCSVVMVAKAQQSPQATRQVWHAERGRATAENQPEFLVPWRATPALRWLPPDFFHMSGKCKACLFKPLIIGFFISHSLTQTIWSCSPLNSPPCLCRGAAAGVFHLNLWEVWWFQPHCRLYMGHVSRGLLHFCFPLNSFPLPNPVSLAL